MCGTGQQDFNRWLLGRIAAGNPPDATIIWTNPASLGVRGGLEPLESFLDRSMDGERAAGFLQQVVAAVVLGLLQLLDLLEQLIDAVVVIGQHLDDLLEVRARASEQPRAAVTTLRGCPTAAAGGRTPSR